MQLDAKRAGWTLGSGVLAIAALILYRQDGKDERGIPSQAVMKTIGSIRELAYQTNKGIWAYRRRWHMV